MTSQQAEAVREYERRVKVLTDQGMSNSDAQAVVDCQLED